MDEEEFRKIRDWPRYSVSSHGNIRNDETGQILTLHPAINEYAMVMLCENGKPVNYIVHRLVAQAFVENPDNLPCVDHIDRNRSNNHYTNLRWITYSDNNRNRPKKQGTTSPYLGVYFHKQKQKYMARIKINKRGVYLGIYPTAELARDAFRQAVIDNHFEHLYPPDDA